MASPYEGLPASRYWRSGVRDQDRKQIEGLYEKRFDIAASTRIATAGSCFAQHIARGLRKRGYSVIDAEPPPPWMNSADLAKYGYRLYSARYGNIYTARQLLQLAREATGTWTPQDIVWEKNGRFFDALRPMVEPNGLVSPDEVRAHRGDHLRRVREVLDEAEVFVFTFGLTEAWVHRDSGTVYPTAPETISGAFDPAVYEFQNFTAAEILGDFLEFRELIRGLNRNVRFLVTVSPVPLTATASDIHVLPATVYSKSVLRAVAGQLYQEHEDIDYFPSYELIATPFLGNSFEDNMRSVRPEGVEMVMRHFFAEHADEPVAATAPKPAKAESYTEDEVCEDALLEAFAS